MTGSTTGQKTTSPASAGNGREGGESPLTSKQGTTKIANIVVQKIAGLAAREIHGMHELGGSTSRAIGALRERIPGASSSAGQGVTVEVGDRQAAIDLEIVVEYGVSITDLAESVRKNVISAIENMTGLEVVEVNIHVNDVHVPDDGSDNNRVQ